MLKPVIPSRFRLLSFSNVTALCVASPFPEIQPIATKLLLRSGTHFVTYDLDCSMLAFSIV